MKVTVHSVVTSICLLGLVALVISQGNLIRDQNQTKAELSSALIDAIHIDEYHDERIKSLEEVVLPGVCVRPDTARLKLGGNNTVIFTVTTCDGRKMSMTRNIGTKA